MSQIPPVSVLLPCYNAEATLEEALQSLFSQTLPDFEIVAVDDGSTDQTGEMLERWAKGDPRLRLLHRSHGGIVQALQAGLEACQGELVARMDAEDQAHPGRL
jgi:glycosyltransferase involved in cell wall biosynthesis